MNYNWKIIERENEKNILELSSDLNNISPYLTNILIHRGITSFDEAKSYFRPQLSDLHDPFLMADMLEAVNKLSDTIEIEEKILIYGDYDVDGCTSVALMYLFLKKFYPNVGYYIPDRHDEGYGISKKGVDYAAENEFTLIIALDCGIKENKVIDYAKQKGVDFIICDHHTPGSELPNAIAVLDPKREDCNYPYKELSGCGVGFKLIQAFQLHHNRDMSEAYDLLDIVVVSIAADIVPINGENRVLAFYGLKKLNSHPTEGLQTIKKFANLSENISITDIVFKIAPRINAAGRIGHAIDALKLLIVKDSEIAMKVAEKIDGINTERKEIDLKMTKEAIDQVANTPNNSSKRSTVIFNENWHKGVVGIVASRLIEHFYRPTIVLTEAEEGVVTGSARSVEGFSVYDAIDECSELLTNFGGHKFAAGITLQKSNLDKFIEKFEEVVSRTITKDQLIPKVYIDTYLNFDEVNSKFVRILKQFAPFGPENMSPVFVTNNVYDTGYVRKVGKDGIHLKLNLISKDSSVILPAIAFNLGNKYDIIKSGKPFNICYSIEENKFNNQNTVQLNIKDIKLA